MSPVAILCTMPGSVYLGLPGVTCYDETRDCRTFEGGAPVVAHPPCRTWGALRQFSRAPHGEHALGPLCVGWVRENGGVLEHPAGSTLWAACEMPRPGMGCDAWGGYTVQVDQFDWGHPCRKRTWLYVAGVRRENLPAMPTREGEPQYLIAPSARQRRSGEGRGHYLPKSKRSVTPVALAEWLVAVARMSQV